MLNIYKDDKGFTLIELLVVIAIVGILAVIAVPALLKNIDKAKISEIESQYSAIKSATLSYYSENPSVHTIKMDELEPYLEDKVPKETPLGGYYQLYSTYDLQTEIAGTTDQYWEGKLVELKDGNIEYKDSGLLKNESGMFLGVRNVVATKDRLTKLIKDIGEGNVYVNSSSQSYKYNIIYLKLIDFSK